MLQGKKGKVQVHIKIHSAHYAFTSISFYDYLIAGTWRASSMDNVTYSKSPAIYQAAVLRSGIVAL